MYLPTSDMKTRFSEISGCYWWRLTTWLYNTCCAGCCSSVHWCRRRGCRGCNGTSKTLDLVKIREKSLKIRAISVEIWAKCVEMQNCYLCFHVAKMAPKLKCRRFLFFLEVIFSFSCFRAR